MLSDLLRCIVGRVDVTYFSALWEEWVTYLGLYIVGRVTTDKSLHRCIMGRAYCGVLWED